ncbi:MAG: hypothetical protein AB9873_18540 [Syntrophobacteraceae bacterium]
MQLWDLNAFFDQHERSMYYVGFLKSSETWFPLCSLSDPPRTTKFDTLLVSSTYEEMDSLLKAYAEKLPKVEQTFVHFLMREEIGNIMDTYALKHLAMTHVEEAEASGCGCGCGCS